jgi:hypothetical protein
MPVAVGPTQRNTLWRLLPKIHMHGISDAGKVNEYLFRGSQPNQEAISTRDANRRSARRIQKAMRSGARAGQIAGYALCDLSGKWLVATDRSTNYTVLRNN